MKTLMILLLVGGAAFAVDVIPVSYTTGGYQTASWIATGGASGTASGLTDQAVFGELYAVYAEPDATVPPLAAFAVTVSETSFRDGGTVANSYDLLNGDGVSLPYAANSKISLIPQQSGDPAVSVSSRLLVSVSSLTTAKKVLITLVICPSFTQFPQLLGLGIETQPAAASVWTGDSYTFGVTLTGGSTPYSYQWYKASTTATVASATLSTLTLTPIVTADGATYYGRGQSYNYPLIGRIMSDGAILTVAAPVTINTQPVANSRYIGETYTYSVVGTGGFTGYGYQWYKAGTTTAYKITSATLTTYAVGTVSTASAADYYAALTDSASYAHAAVFTTAAPLSVTTAPGISTQPTAASRYDGETYTFSATMTGTATL